jgi:uncharacterized protein YndB with AHSA1/START domain
VLVRYRAAIAIAAEGERGPEAERTIRLQRTLPAAPAAVWRAWTTAEAVRRWWSPRHFTVAECEIEPVPGGALRIVMTEGDGTRHRSDGRFLTLRAPGELRFELAPLDDGGTPMFSAEHDVHLTPSGSGTRLAMTIRVTGHGPAAAPALAGMRIGWEQLLDKLAAVLSPR